ncbi:molybdopterin converting factor subunit 1 [Massilia glaciei]|uniref:Molybdopterin synthase sulfur carrier subunit n=1 Tax=Massilia glaciei TaxID=1524097 RepID=A0A2U2HG58_9BURK|nr:molybdopterin converting factor subunit 1 [Massilia glaciei]PWF43689.1 molybdopterin converting factor subunit 1 [Massilia glaciei]
MNINLRFFASVRETVGVSEESLTLPAGVTTVGAVRELLAARGGAWAEALAPRHTLRTAHNQVMCPADTELSDDCEVAFFPPVTGG